MRLGFGSQDWDSSLEPGGRANGEGGGGEGENPLLCNHVHVPIKANHTSVVVYSSAKCFVIYLYSTEKKKLLRDTKGQTGLQVSLSRSQVWDKVRSTLSMGK